MAGIQSMQQFIPVRTPTANENLSEGMLSWSLVLPPVTNILQIAGLTRKDHHPVRITRSIAPFATVGNSSLLPKDFQYSSVNATPPAGGTTTGQTGAPSTTGGTAATAPVPVVSNDTPVSYAVYTFKPTVTQSVATVTQLRSITLSLSYYLPDWTFAIWIPSLQRYMEYIPSAINDVPEKWVTINAATNIEASGTASIEFIFGLRQAQATDLTAPYGSIAVNNYQVSEHMFIAGLGGGGAGLETRVTALEGTATQLTTDVSNLEAEVSTLLNAFSIAENRDVTFPGAVTGSRVGTVVDAVVDLDAMRTNGTYVLNNAASTNGPAPGGVPIDPRGILSVSFDGIGNYVQLLYAENDTVRNYPIYQRWYFWFNAAWTPWTVYTPNTI